MGNCGIPTFTCVLLLLIMAALYASASPREDDFISNYNVAVSDLIQSDDTPVMHLRVPREAQHGRNGARTNLNRRGNPGRTADSGNNGITRAGPRRIGGRPDRRPRPEGRRRRPRPGNRRPLPAGVNRRMLRMATKVHNASNPFAGQLFQEILPTITHNMVISPFSVHTALTMTMLGARGRTARELYNALGLKDVRLRNEKAHQAYQGLRASLDDIHEEVKIHSANAVFVKPNIPLEDSFRQGLSLMYGASFDNFDYNHPLGPAGPINAWVANMTENRIQNLIGPGTITPLTAMILINAIYFKAAWLRPFSETSTQQQEFHTLSRGTRMMDMMQQTGSLGYLASDGVQVVELPYVGLRLSFYVLLPNEGTDINQLLRQIPHRSSLFEDVNRAHVQLTLPKFRVESGLLDLKRPLQNLGIRKAFDEDEADFSGISASAELHINDVFHKAFIDVNEAGTEAAAATAVVFGLRSSYHPRSVEVNVNRPFLFAIRDKEMKVILFLGAFVGHSAEESG